MTRVLVVDDEPQIRKALRLNLVARGYEVELASSGEEALVAAGRSKPDVVLLDLGLPGIDGVQVIEGIRGWSDMPIIVLSARGAERDKVDALDVGADDYVTKPFGIEELLARLRSAIRRRRPAPDAPIVVTDDFTIDLLTTTITRDDDTPIHLTPIEWRILENLVRNEGKLVAQKQLLKDVWGPSYGEETNYLRVHLTHLRHKLEPDSSRPRYLITEPGMGYRFLSHRDDAGDDHLHPDDVSDRGPDASGSGDDASM